MLSKPANFSVGCCCEDETRCHRSVLRELLKEAGAEIVWRVVALCDKRHVTQQGEILYNGCVGRPHRSNHGKGMIHSKEESNAA